MVTYINDSVPVKTTSHFLSRAPQIRTVSCRYSGKTVHQSVLWRRQGWARPPQAKSDQATIPAQPIMFGLSLVDWPEGPRGGTTFQQVTTDGALTKNLKLWTREKVVAYQNTHRLRVEAKRARKRLEWKCGYCAFLMEALAITFQLHELPCYISNDTSLHVHFTCYTLNKRVVWYASMQCMRYPILPV